jgi:hypothetical protein
VSPVKKPLVRTAGVSAAVGFAGLAIFEYALAKGAPLGRAARGGTETELSAGLRVASAFAIVFYLAAGLAVLRCAGYAIQWISPRFAHWATSALALILPLSGLGNFASGSPWERYLMGPIALVLGGLCFVVARGTRAETRGEARHIDAPAT